MHTIRQKRERGFSLVVALLALMLLSAVAVGMMFMASTETAVSSNFKAEETAYFAARAGVEEVRDRMLPVPASPAGNVTNWLGQISSYSINGSLPAFMPGAGEPWALYILAGKNPQTGANMAIGDVADVAKLVPTNIVADDELCHDFPSYTGMTPAAANIRCNGTTGLPAGTTWRTSTTSMAPLPVDFKWVRVTLKANNSYGTSNTTLVDNSPAKPAGGQVCWSGSGAGAHQVVAGAGQSCDTIGASPVYLLTALAVSPSGGSNGAKRMVQLEIAQTYKSSKPPDGLFAAGKGCGPPDRLKIAGNARTGSFNSATGSPPVLSGGNVGSNGNVTLGGSSTDVHGKVHTNLPASVGGCPANGVSVSGGAKYDSIDGIPPYDPPIPPMPNPLPPTSNVTLNGATLVASGGPWGNVTIKGTVTLTGGTTANPAVYTMNSLSENGGATLRITGPVILNLAGVGVATVLDLTGNSFVNTTHVPSNFVINYGGSDVVKLNGGGEAYGVINAPNAPITFKGGSDFFGQALGNTIDVQGNTAFWWDTSLSDPPTPNTDAFHEVAMRELSY